MSTVKQHESGFNPYGVIAEGTPFELHPFGFESGDGVEVFSILVPTVREPTVHRILQGKPDPIDLLAKPRIVLTSTAMLLKYEVLRWLGREGDADRCSIACRLQGKRIEIRLKFSPPWWYGR